MPSSAPVDGDTARRAAQAELRRAEYHRDDPGLVDRAVQWLGRRIGDLFSGSTSSNLLLVLVLLVAAVLVFLVVRAGPPRPGRDRAPAADPLAPVPAADHRRLAEEHERAGEFADALREWLRAAIQTIEDRGVLDPRPGRTGAGVAREAGALLPSAAAGLAAATTAFDAVWFGGRPATAADAAVAHRAADEVGRAPVQPAVAAGLVAPR